MNASVAGANWFRDRIRAGDDEQQLIPAFAAYKAEDLRAGGATEEQVRDYETDDPSYYGGKRRAAILAQVSS
jgi:hypothetical protein